MSVISEALDEINSDNLIIGGLTLQEAQEKGRAAIKQKAIDKKQRKKEILLEAINSDFIDLNAPLSVAHKRTLIHELTQQYTCNMQHHEKYINETICKLLKSVMPHDLLNAWYNYKDSFIPMLGFTYTASEEFGQGLRFKVSLDLPMYFMPNDCQKIIEENWPKKLKVLDKAVAFFYKHKEIRSQREVKIAKQLTRISTFYQLAQFNPFWYDTLIKKLKQTNDEIIL